MGIEILTIGALLVEIMRKEKNKPFNMPADFIGPFPSGGSAIFIDAAARLGNSTGMVAVVGNDGFGECCLNRFKEDKISTEMIRVNPDKTTATAFVGYYDDGSRDFIYHVKDAASSEIREDDVKIELLKDVKWLHLSVNTICGASGTRKAVDKIIKHMPATARISIDPNIRTQLSDNPDMDERIKPFIERASVLFPSEGEMTALTGNKDEDEACRKLAKDKIVVYKKGSKGCIVYKGSEKISVPSFEVEEIDPTGAGDCFAAGFLTALNEEKSLYDCGLFANAVGALSIRKKGPMEGAPFYEEVLEFIR